jgi:HSP20 family protein
MLALNLIDDFVNLKSVVDELLSGTSAQKGMTRADYPPVKIFEKEDDLRVEMAVPGVKKEDISLNLTDDQLNIEVRKSRNETEEKYVRKERLSGNFSRSIKMPFRIDRNSINAGLADGILTLGLKKSEEAKAKKIEIK